METLRRIGNWLTQGLREENGWLALAMIASAALLVAGGHAGLWHLPFIAGNLSEITLTLLCLFILVSMAQLQGLRKLLRELKGLLHERGSISITLRSVGVAKVWVGTQEGVDEWRELLENAMKLDIIAVCALHWIIGEERILRKLLQNGCCIRVLPAKPDSKYVTLREKREGRPKGTIARNVRQACSEWESYVGGTAGAFKGTLEIRYCDGDIPSRVDIINDETILWVPYIPPARSTDTPTLLVRSGRNYELASHLKGYFETAWRQSSKNVALKRPEG